MWPLEYLFLFGVPDNKLELIKGRSRWAFPFVSRESAEAHFADWCETIRRWKGIATVPSVKRGPVTWKTELDNIALKLYPRPIEANVRVNCDAFHAFYETHLCPDFWPEQPANAKSGILAHLDHQDVALNLWQLFRGVAETHGGCSGGRTDVAMSDTAAVQPDQYYFQKSPEDCMIHGNYFRGIPDLIAEVLSPPSRVIDRGPRFQLYRRAGVPRLWLLDPEAETVEVYVRVGRELQLECTYQCGEEIRCDLFPCQVIQTDALFHTQNKRHPEWTLEREPRTTPEWIIAPEAQLGLEYFFLLGHPERRWEIWNNRCYSVLAFGSPTEAKSRLAYFIREACQWEGLPLIRPRPLDERAEQAEIGRFKLTCKERYVTLDVAVDARKYHQLLEVWARRDVWDWGKGN